MKVNSRLPTLAPLRVAPQRSAQARTAARCCGRRPGCGRRARAFTTRRGWPSSAATATAYRTIVPLPDFWAPSIVSIRAVLFPDSRVSHSAGYRDAGLRQEA